MKYLTDQFQLGFCFCISNTKQLYFISALVTQLVSLQSTCQLLPVLPLVGKNPYGRDFSAFVGSRESLREKSPFCRDFPV